ncbi:MAG: glycine oxidase ThiO [Gemmataceae bacterium]|nr:glycine oxidase ThiO [Gemmataceae bacterium]
MAKTADVVIVGGGVIGLTTAYYLGRARLRVVVLDQGAFGSESSWAGAGIIPPGNPELARSPFDQLRAWSATLFPELSRELREATGIDNGYLRCGGLEFTAHDDGVAAEEWRGEGVAAQALTAERTRALEPELAESVGAAVLLPDMAQVRNPWHIRALIAACRLLGVDLRPHEAGFDFLRDGERIVAVQTASGDLAGDTFVVAAGAWTDLLLANLGCRLGIHPVRGQIVLLHPERPMLSHILLWGPRYLVPRGDGRILVGSTEENAGFEKRNTDEGVHGLLRLATTLVPALAQAPVEKCWAGLRPASRDGLPIIGPMPNVANLYIASGHFRAGIQTSIGSALLLKQMILGEPLFLAAEAFQVPVPNARCDQRDAAESS